MVLTGTHLPEKQSSLESMLVGIVLSLIFVVTHKIYEMCHYLEIHYFTLSSFKYQQSILHASIQILKIY